MLSVKRFLFAAVCLSAALLWGCGDRNRYRCQGRPFEEGPNIRLMSFNIRCGTADDGPDSWLNRKELVFDVICQGRADIVGLQEALYFQVKEINRAFRQYRRVGAGRDDGKKKGEHCCIFYRKDRFRVAEEGTFWFSNSPWVPGSVHWGGACTRICTWVRLVEKATERGFYVYNLHLDHVSQVSRQKSVELLVKKVSRRRGDEPFIVMGDFNAGPDNEAILYLRGAGSAEYMGPEVMVDTFGTLHRYATGAGTYHGFSGATDGERIDYIFVGTGTEIVDAQILRTNAAGRYPSDHFPVTAEIGLLE